MRLLALVAFAGAGAGCAGDDSGPADTSDLAGNTSCLACHQEQATFLETAHHRSSALADTTTVHGSFTGEESVLRTSNSNLRYRMEERADGLYQVALIGSPPGSVARSGKIDLVIGSGRKGQSYLSWRDGDRLFQLPASYWTELQRWVNSPGYPDGVLNFERPIPPRCLECHAGLFESVPGAGVVNQYDAGSFTVGITCERCHGPGAEHVARQRSPIRRFFGSAIINPAELPRERQIEVCAQCHGGIGEPVAPAFSYRPGQPLEEHLRLIEPLPGAEIDVHGNQVALLARSPCFQQSSMTCSTCHDPHTTERDPAALSAKCMSCHQPQQCGLFPEQGHAITDRCTACHMPELRSNAIISNFEGRSVQPSVRTHWIRVYGREGATGAE